MAQPPITPPFMEQLGFGSERAEKAGVGRLWRKFSELATIPRPTGKETQAAQWVENWATKRNYEVFRDSYGNVFVKVSPSNGFVHEEGIPNLIFQGHLDMVDMPPAGANDTDHISPGIYGVKPKVDTKKVGDEEVQIVVGENKGKRTSLGADNGIGVAGMMAMAEYFDEHPDTPHDGFGLLFTLHEEDGLLGAHNLDIPEVFQPNTIVINGDNEAKGKVYLGSAGGGYTTAKMHVDREILSFSAKAFTLSIDGHHGGHSGEDIHKVLTNANQTMGTLLQMAADADIDIRLAAINGGQRMNAIPSAANAIVVLNNPAQAKDFETLLKKAESKLRETNNEPDFQINLKEVAKEAQPVTVLTQKATAKIRRLLTDKDLPHGVKSTETLGNLAGNTRTSTNFATIQLTDNFLDEWVDLGFMTRSSSMNELEEQRRAIAAEIQKVDREFAQASGHEPQITQGEAFPSWEPGHDQQALALLQYVSQHEFGETLKEDTTHGGLEIGEFLKLFTEHFPNQPRQVQFVSFGPTINNPHSIHEEVEVATVEWFYNMLLAIPQLLPEWYRTQGARR